MSILDTLYEMNIERIRKGERVLTISYPEDEKAEEEEKYKEREMIINNWNKKKKGRGDKR